MTPFTTSRSINWFPGHMAKATKSMRGQLRNCDLIIEVRDARIPLSSANPLLDEIAGNKPRLIVLNKMDLADPGARIHVERYFSARRHDFIFSRLIDDRRRRSSVQEILGWAYRNCGSTFKTTGSLIMIVGMPNVGKSTLINKLRTQAMTRCSNSNKQVAKVGSKPGVTRQVQTYKVNEDPLLYLVDTPGVMVPRVKDTEVGLKLGLIGAIKDEVVGVDLLSDYLLHCLRHRKCYQSTKPYIEKIPGAAADDDLTELLSHIYKAIRTKGKVGQQQPTSPHVDKHMIMSRELLLGLFRQGKMGRCLMTLDDIPQVQDNTAIYKKNDTICIAPPTPL